jgi:hypothetical protein
MHSSQSIWSNRRLTFVAPMACAAAQILLKFFEVNSIVKKIYCVGNFEGPFQSEA